MGDVAAQRGYIAHLRAANQVTGLDQRLGVLRDQQMARDAAQRHRGANEELPVPHLELVQLEDRGQVN
ncbi:MAG: hypothetical protein WEB88_11260 [Gemmatimonadota bacterium]